eukprot:TRINITY_DN5644_c0_g1_i1.p1 TRINITY_DN5644_c0_g1~~TRINITY_DN5644_c0_g1_i1.p1  ORF type:complete len:645 (+),score=173.18 TRINITY_DN5644_c0_g1_i1:160-2094(+)
MDEEVQHAPRRDVNPYAPQRVDTLHVYGVNFLSTKEVLGAFGKWEAQEVEWLDDSSCNVKFKDQDAAHQARKDLAEAGPEEAHAECLDVNSWTKTRPVPVGATAQAGRRRTKARDVQFELRAATEADRKDPGHSGHTDSVYYAKVKETQKQQKLEVEARREKKRQRTARLPNSAEIIAKLRQSKRSASKGSTTPGDASQSPPEAMEDELDDSWADGAAKAVSSGSPAPAAAAAAAADAQGANVATTPFAGKLGMRGLMDPLLFLRAPGADDAAKMDTSSGGVAGGATSLGDDLRSMLQQAEAEYAAVPLAAMATPAVSSSGPRRRANSVGSVGRGPNGRRQPGAAEADKQRGKKRRPVDQEPRPVTDAAPAERRLQAIPCVEEFIKEQRIRCQRFNLSYTYRHLKWREEKQRKTRKEKQLPELKKEKRMIDQLMQKPKVGKEVERAKYTQEELDAMDCWDQWVHLNHHFSRRGVFCHTVAFKAGDRRIDVIVPHPRHSDPDRIAKAAQVPRESLRRYKIGELQKDGFPQFVNPPFGGKKDAQGRAPLLLVDSLLLELKRPLLFDVGSVGLAMMARELLRAAGGVSIEGLSFMPEARSKLPGSPGQPEPAPEPAPVALAAGATPLEAQEAAVALPKVTQDVAMAA